MDFITLMRKYEKPMMNKNGLGGVFCELLFKAHMPDNKKAALHLGLSERTIRRYKNGESKPPLLLLRYLAILSGDLSAINPAFEGWHIKDNELCSSNGERFSSARLEHIRCAYDQWSYQNSEYRKLENEIARLKEKIRTIQLLSPNINQLNFLKEK